MSCLSVLTLKSCLFFSDVRLSLPCSSVCPVRSWYYFMFVCPYFYVMPVFRSCPSVPSKFIGQPCLCDNTREKFLAFHLFPETKVFSTSDLNRMYFRVLQLAYKSFLLCYSRICRQWIEDHDFSVPGEPVKLDRETIVRCVFHRCAMAASAISSALSLVRISMFPFTVIVFIDIHEWDGWPTPCSQVGSFRE